MEPNVVKLSFHFAFIIVVLVFWYCFVDFVFSTGFAGNKHIEPEKVSCTVLSASHDFVGWLGSERFSVIVEVDGEIYEINDRNTYYLYCDKIGSLSRQNAAAVLLLVKLLWNIVYIFLVTMVLAGRLTVSYINNKTRRFQKNANYRNKQPAFRGRTVSGRWNQARCIV